MRKRSEADTLMNSGDHEFRSKGWSIKGLQLQILWCHKEKVFNICQQSISDGGGDYRSNDVDME